MLWASFENQNYAMGIIWTSELCYWYHMKIKAMKIIAMLRESFGNQSNAMGII